MPQPSDRRETQELTATVERGGDSAQFLHRLIETIPLPIFHEDGGHRILDCNHAFETCFGFSRNNLIGRTVRDLCPTDVVSLYQAATEDLLKDPDGHIGKTSVTDVIGNRQEMVLLRTTWGKRDEIIGIIKLETEASELAKAEHNRQDDLHLVEQLIDTIPNPVFYKDAVGRYLGCNRAFTEYVGKTKQELIGKSVYELWDKDLADAYQRADQALFDKKEAQIYEAKVVYADGSRHDVVFHKAPFYKRDGRLGGLIGVIWDVTERRRAEAALRTYLQAQALHDPLTSLFNRRHLDDVLVQEIEHATTTGERVGVIMADIDHFKNVNDAFGHACGDEVLCAIAKLLIDNVRKSDVVCRYGGEEFVVVMPDATRDAALARAEKIRMAVKSATMTCDGRTVGPVTISLGVALFPDNGSSGRLVLDAADQVLLHAKAQGRDQVMAADVVPSR
jgi:diguanylate cyclase (GGDEF)-like protein/PAS domain S-box-containing protein